MKNILLGLTVFMVFLSSCTKDFEDYNTDKKNPSVVEGEFLFTNAQKALVDQISSTNVNRNVWKLFSQYWTETTYTDEANYDIINRSIPDNTFDTYYRRVLKPLDEAKRLITEDELGPLENEELRTNKLAIIELLEAYSYFNLVTIFGDVPYSEALDIENINPKYDDGALICKDLVVKIDSAYNDLKGLSSYGSADLIYNGNVPAWKKFAMSLKLKIAVVLADADRPEITSSVWANEAIGAGVFTSGVDDALLKYQGAAPNTNPLYEDLVASGRKDFVPANTLVDMLNGFNDPRYDKYLTNPVAFSFPMDENENLLNDTVTDGLGKILIYSTDSIVYRETPFILDPLTRDSIITWYVGGKYGASNSFNGNSHIHDDIQKAQYHGILMTYDEVEFYIAEAAARGFDVGQTAEDAYNTAITASFNFWSIQDNNIISSYLESENVAWATASGDWREKIGTQAYLAFYTRGYIGYTEYRRLDFPTMNVAPSAATSDGSVPARFTYPVNEQTLNADNYAAAAEAIGGDNLETKLFWDVN